MAKLPKTNQELFSESVSVLMKKYKVGMNFKFAFPGLEKPPYLARFAFFLLNRLGFELKIEVVPLVKTDNEKHN